VREIVYPVDAFPTLVLLATGFVQDNHKCAHPFFQHQRDANVLHIAEGFSHQGYLKEKKSQFLYIIHKLLMAQ